MPQDPLAFALRAMDLAIAAEEEQGLAPGEMVAALFSAAAATLAHHFGWERETLLAAAAELTQNRAPHPRGGAVGVDAAPSLTRH